MLQQRILMVYNQSLLDRRFFNGMVTFMNKPLERQYFILDAKTGRFYTYKSMCQELPSEDILLTQCLMTFQTDYPMVNEDLEHRFDV